MFSRCDLQETDHLHMFFGGAIRGIALPHVFSGCDLQEIDLLHMFELLCTFFGGWVKIKLKLPHFHVSDTSRVSI